MYEACYPMEEGKILHEEHIEWPLFDVTIYGTKLETLKISKRLMCSIKHLPLRLSVHYEHSTEKAIEAGVAKDPTIIWNGKNIIEGLIPAEEITEIFENLLKEVK